MKTHINTTNIEIPVPSDRFIVSKTDLTGRITYVNRVFMEVSGFKEAELLRKQHNVIRHPDMPRGVFRLLWNTLKAEREFFGFVKNLTADGGYYWVFANITPDRDADGRLKGYYSVRRTAPRHAIEQVAPLYAEMVRIERAAGPAAAPDASLRWLDERLAQMSRSYEQFVLQLFS